MFMGGSYKNQAVENLIINRINMLFPDGNCSVLDVGPGYGKYGRLLQMYAKQIDAVEIYEPMIEINGIDKVYDNVFISDICDFEFDYYDIIIFGDVLEHIDPDKAKKLLDRIYDKAKEIFIVVPYLYEQDAFGGNPYEVHLQPDLTHELFLERYPKFKCLHRDSFQGLYTKIDAKIDSNYKICVYAIAKNEEKFAAEWYDSMSEADYIVVLDTGSTDRTVEILKEKGAIVESKIIDPWRFDVARNDSMKLIPKDADIAVCTDLDELFDSGWATILREFWTDDAEKAQSRYTWNYDKDGKPRIRIWYQKIHDNRGNWYWEMPIHETLTHRVKSGNDIKMVLLPEEFHLHHQLVMDNIEGPKKSYLPLMEVAIKENPTGFMENWYYGRELYFHKRYEDSARQLEYVQTLPDVDYRYQKSGSLIYLGNAYFMLGDYKKAEHAYLKSTELVTDIRDPLINLQLFYYNTKRWYACIDTGLRAIEINPVRSTWYEDERNYKEIPHDYLSIAYYYIGDYKNSLKHIDIALGFDPNDERMVKNKEFILKKLNEGGHQNE